MSWQCSTTMSTGFWATESSRYCSTLHFTGPSTACSSATATRWYQLMPLPLLPCSRHLSAVSFCFTAVLICILVLHRPQSSRK